MIRWARLGPGVTGILKEEGSPTPLLRSEEGEGLAVEMERAQVPLEARKGQMDSPLAPLEGHLDLSRGRPIGLLTSDLQNCNKLPCLKPLNLWSSYSSNTKPIHLDEQ